MIFVHTDFINFFELLGVFWIDLFMSRGTNFLDHSILSGCEKRIIEVADTENDAPYTPNISF